MVDIISELEYLIWEADSEKLDIFLTKNPDISYRGMVFIIDILNSLQKLDINILTDILSKMIVLINHGGSGNDIIDDKYKITINEYYNSPSYNGPRNKEIGELLYLSSDYPYICQDFYTISNFPQLLISKYLRLGLNPNNYIDYYGHTLLDIAVFKDYPGLVSDLLKHGAKLNIKSDKNMIDVYDLVRSDNVRRILNKYSKASNLLTKSIKKIHSHEKLKNVAKKFTLNENWGKPGSMVWAENMGRVCKEHNMCRDIDNIKKNCMDAVYTDSTGKLQHYKKNHLYFIAENLGLTPNKSLTKSDLCNLILKFKH